MEENKETKKTDKPKRMKGAIVPPIIFRLPSPRNSEGIGHARDGRKDKDEQEREKAKRDGLSSMSLRDKSGVCKALRQQKNNTDY